MKKRFSICFYSVAAAGAAAVIFILLFFAFKQHGTDVPEHMADDAQYFGAADGQQTEEEEKALESMAVIFSEGTRLLWDVELPEGIKFSEGAELPEEVKLPEGVYLLKESDGFLVVYYQDENTVFDETNIRVDFLPEEMQEMLKGGILIHGVEELYDFLESYSS